MKLSIIIPAFNEEKTIATIIKKVHGLSVKGLRKEIIVVNDGSTDKTHDKISHLSRRYKIKFLEHAKNLGKGAAVKSGIRAAKGEIIVIQDADLEYNPEDIPKLLIPLMKKETQAVYGTRLKRPPHLFREERTLQFLLHYFGNRMLSMIASLLYGQWITDIETGYKIFQKKTVKLVNLRAQGFEFEAEITAKLLKRRIKIIELPIDVTPRSYSEGKKINSLKDGTKALYALIKYRFRD